MRAAIFIGVYFLFFSTGALAQKATVRFKKYTWYQGLTLAKQQNKSLFLYISQPGCDYCKEFNAITLKNRDLVMFLNKHFILIKHSVKTKYGEAIARDYHLQSTPALLLQKPGSAGPPLILYENLNAEELLNKLKAFLDS